MYYFIFLDDGDGMRSSALRFSADGEARNGVADGRRFSGGLVSARAENQ